MAPETLKPGEIGAESCQTTGTSTNAPPGETQHQHSHSLVHHDAAIVGTENMAKNTHLKTECITGSSNNKRQYVIGCESIHIGVEDGQLTL